MPDKGDRLMSDSHAPAVREPFDTSTELDSTFTACLSAVAGALGILDLPSMP
jgi:hypothetical protein